VLGTFTVTNTNDAGAGSLRQAITNANASSGADTITFNIAGGGVKTITLASALPTVTDTVVLNAETQPGYASTPLIELNGASAGGAASALTLGSGASGSVIEGFIINQFQINGIYLNAADNVTIQGNWIGVDSTGNAASVNGGSGILIDGGSNNTVGGSSAAARNVVSGNGNAGISLTNQSNDNTIQGNYIGTDAAGASSIENQSGIWIGSTSTGNTIGGTAAGSGNLISGNTNNGIDVVGGSTGTLIEANLIGTDATGTAAVANGQYGINLASDGNTIGGLTAAARNVIYGNSRNGIVINANNNIVEGNYIGVDATGAGSLSNSFPGVFIGSTGASGNTIGGTAAGAGNVIANHSKGVIVGIGTGNAILGNSIHDNSAIGIDIGSNGVTANDAGDADTGANDLQNFPVITSATSNGGNITFVGSLNSNASTTYRIEFFASPGADSSGYGEGAAYLGFVDVTTDGSGNASISATMAGASVGGKWVSATATNLTNEDTSEFALSVLGKAAPTVAASGGTTAFVAGGGAVAVDPGATVTDADSATLASATASISANFAGGQDTLAFTNTSSAAFGNIAASYDAAAGVLSLTSAGATATLAQWQAALRAVTYDNSSATPSTASRTISFTANDGGLASAASSQAVSVSPTHTFIVTNTNDSGAGSLRQAITDANANAGTDTIVFNIGTGFHTIGLTSALPTITDTALLDATTQPGYGGTPLIELNGASAGNGIPGLELTFGASNSLITGFVINRFQSDGIYLNTASNVTIRGNWIGVDPAGNSPMANTGAGIHLNNSNGDVIGGNTAAARNVLSGNAIAGVQISNSSIGNIVQGNYIGTDATGAGPIQNGDGILIQASSTGNTIGGTAAGAGNLISGNTNTGIEVKSASANTQILGNYIGVNAAGMAALQNGQYGVLLQSDGNTVGGTTAAARNVVSGNNGSGIAIQGASGNVVAGNYVGVGADGAAVIANGDAGANLSASSNGNTIGGAAAGAGNVFSGNVREGIRIEGASANNSVLGNYVGLDAGGTIDKGNGAAGILIDGSAGNTVGGTAAGAGNVVSGNAGEGISVVGSDSTTVQGNLVGTNAAGTGAIANNYNGVVFDSSDNGTLGGTSAAARNVIAGNSQQGVAIRNGSTGNSVLGNYIGVNASGLGALGNGWAGVFIQASGNTIGGAAAGAGNVISGNGQLGVQIDNGANNAVQGNRIGLAASGAGMLANGWSGIELTGTDFGNQIGVNVIAGNTEAGVKIDAGTGNTLSGNSIYGNTALGIDLNADGVTADDPGDGDSGADDSQNFPVIANAVRNGGTVTISFGLSGAASTNYVIEFFAGPAAHGSGYGLSGGSSLLGSLSVSTDGGGNASSSPTFAYAGGWITATATNLATGDTSEFALSVPVDSAPVVATSGGAATFTAGGAAVAVDPGLTVSDADNATLASATASITGNFAGGEDALAFANDGSTMGNIAGSYDAATGVLSLSSAGAVATLAQWQAALRAVTYIDGSGTPSTANRTVSFAVDDGTSNSAAATRTVSFNGPQTFVVTNTNDSGAGSLRQAILDANAHAGFDDIVFSIGSGPQTIAPTSSLPVVTDAVSLDARTQPGYGSTPLIELDGTSSANSFELTSGASGSVIAGFAIGHFSSSDGIFLNGASGVTVQSNWIGLDAAGNAAANSFEGIHLLNSSNDLIGGTTAAVRNVISGNADAGIQLEGNSSNNTIAGNYIGTSADGASAIANLMGILIQSSATGNTIGGTGAGAGNLISGNTQAGISFNDGSATGNVVQGNVIGLAADGATALGNGGDGVTLASAAGNLIGGAAAGAGNVISG
ncbi:MAG: right-handed parallel beta-helix repeat-containing protein, partial [Burkholderiaceae bacterium]